MPGPWITADGLLDYAAATLKVAKADLPALWTTIATQAVAQSYGDLLQIMAGKGYSIGQLDAWDSRVAFSNTQGLYRLGSMGGGFASYDKEFFEQFNLIEFLTASGIVTTGGEAVAPAGNDLGGIRTGVLDSVDSVLDPNSTLDPPSWGLGARWPW